MTAIKRIPPRFHRKTSPPRRKAQRNSYNQIPPPADLSAKENRCTRLYAWRAFSSDWACSSSPSFSPPHYANRRQSGGWGGGGAVKLMQFPRGRRRDGGKKKLPRARVTCQSVFTLMVIRFWKAPWRGRRRGNTRARKARSPAGCICKIWFPRAALESEYRASTELETVMRALLVVPAVLMRTGDAFSRREKAVRPGLAGLVGAYLLPAVEGACCLDVVWLWIRANFACLCSVRREEMWGMDVFSWL